MKIIKPSYEIMDPLDGEEILRKIERCGRVCYKSEDKITDGSAEKFVRVIIQRGHESVLEHVSFTVRFVVDRGVSHELVRHRLASYSQESTRYVGYSKRNVKIVGQDDVISAYCDSGMSMKKIAERSDGRYTEWDIYKILNENDVPRRSVGRRGIIDDNYFETIDTPEKAYLVGFIMADGCIRKDLKQLTISQKEEEQWWILNMIREFIQPDAKSLTLHGEKICTDLYKKGIVPNKTYVFTKDNAGQLWEAIPREYKYDFIRGELDGDGSIRWFYQLDTSKRMSCHIQFSGNKYLMEKIADFVAREEKYIAKVKKDRDSDYLYRYTITNGEVGRIFCEKMYKNFKFPYGHSKTARYYEAFGIEVPIDIMEYDKTDFNAIVPNYASKLGVGLWKWGAAMQAGEMMYKNMIDSGATPQEARAVLPNSLKTEVVMTANLREWRHVLKLRTAPAAHPQIREVMCPLLDELKRRVPVVFDDIGGN